MFKGSEGKSRPFRKEEVWRGRTGGCVCVFVGVMGSRPKRGEEGEVKCEEPSRVLT